MVYFKWQIPVDAWRMGHWFLGLYCLIASIVIELNELGIIL